MITTWLIDTGYRHQVDFENLPSRACMGTPPPLHFHPPTDDFAYHKGGEIIYDSSQISELSSAVLAFSENVTDPKACMFVSNVFENETVGIHSSRWIPDWDRRDQ